MRTVRIRFTSSRTEPHTARFRRTDPQQAGGLLGDEQDQQRASAQCEGCLDRANVVGESVRDEVAHITPIVEQEGTQESFPVGVEVVVEQQG
jgi:hypothetical protein